MAALDNQSSDPTLTPAAIAQQSTAIDTPPLAGPRGTADFCLDQKGQESRRNAPVGPTVPPLQSGRSASHDSKLKMTFIRWLRLEHLLLRLPNNLTLSVTIGEQKKG